MGTPHASFAWLTVTALTVGLVTGLPHVTLANDVGPGKEVRTLRRQLPILLSGRLTDAHQPLSGLAIDSVVIGNEAAAAQWHDGPLAGTAQLMRRYDRWWIENGVPGNGAESAIPAIRERQIGIDAAPYDARLTFGVNDAPATARLALHGRAPTAAESWMTDGGNSFFFFSGTVQSSAPIRIDAGTTLDVWFPFVLDTSLHYAVTIAHADAPIGPIDGTLEGNAVHFILPAFALAPGAELHGEIEGDAWAHR